MDIEAEIRAALDAYRASLSPLQRLMFDALSEATAEEMIYGARSGIPTGILGPATQHAQRPPEDRLPRRRNPRLWCEQHENGTWIHGTPHNCPAWARR